MLLINKEKSNKKEMEEFIYFNDEWNKDSNIQQVLRD